MSARYSVTVGTSDLRAALASTLVHACQDPELPDLMRVRITPGAVNVAVSATDRYTLALALASHMNDGEISDDTEPFDLLPDDVAKILSIFKAGKESGDDPQYWLRLDVAREHVTITDASGLIDGRSFKVPRLKHDDGDVLAGLPNLVARAHNSDAALLEDMAVNGKLLARFETAAKSYHNPLIIESHVGTHALLIRCGESFLGLLIPVVETPEKLVERKEWADAWARRLPVAEPDGPVYHAGPSHSAGEQ